MNEIGRRDILRRFGSTAASLCACERISASCGAELVTQASAVLAKGQQQTGANTTKPVLFDADGNLIIAARISDDGSRVGAVAGRVVRAWDASTERLLLQRDDLPAPAQTVAINADGTLVATGGWAKEEWRTTARELRSPDGAVTIFTGRRVSVQHGGLIRIWETAHGSLVRQIDVKGEPPKLVAFARKNSCIVSVSEDLVLRVWDIGSGELTLTQDELQTSAIAKSGTETSAVSASADGDRIAVLHSEQSAQARERDLWTHHLCLWDLKSAFAKATSCRRRYRAEGSRRQQRRFPRCHNSRREPDHSAIVHLWLGCSPVSRRLSFPAILSRLRAGLGDTRRGGRQRDCRRASALAAGR